MAAVADDLAGPAVALCSVVSAYALRSCGGAGMAAAEEGGEKTHAAMMVDAIHHTVVCEVVDIGVKEGLAVARQTAATGQLLAAPKAAAVSVVAELAPWEPR